MTKATKNSLFGSKDDKRAQTQELKREEQVKATAEARKNLKTSSTRSVSDGAEFKLFVDDWESRVGGSLSVHSKPADSISSSSGLEYQPSSSSSSSSSHISLKVPMADEVYEMGDIESLARLQMKDIPTLSDSTILPQTEKARNDNERRPGGTEIIELDSPVELDRLTECPESLWPVERRKKNRFNGKEKTKIVTLAKVQLEDVSTISKDPVFPQIGKAGGDNERRPGGTEVIELESPVELDRLTECPKSLWPVERRKKNRFNGKEMRRDVRIVVRNGD